MKSFMNRKNKNRGNKDTSNLRLKKHKHLGSNLRSQETAQELITWKIKNSRDTKIYGFKIVLGNMETTKQDPETQEFVT